MLGAGLSMFIQKLSCSVMWTFLLEGRAYYYRIYYLFINCNLGYCNKSVNTTTTNSTRIGKKKARVRNSLRAVSLFGGQRELFSLRAPKARVSANEVKASEASPR